MSPPLRGRSRTRSPTCNSTPPTVHAIERRLVFQQLPFPFVHCDSSGLRAQSAQGAVEFLKMFRRQHFGSFENLAGAIVAVPHFQLFGVGQVRIRSARISSISVPSKRSPGLSGAICG